MVEILAPEIRLGGPNPIFGGRTNDIFNPCLGGGSTVFGSLEVTDVGWVGNWCTDLNSEMRLDGPASTFGGLANVIFNPCLGRASVVFESPGDTGVGWVGN